MDELGMGPFELSVAWNDHWKDWQLENAILDLRARVRRALAGLQRDGIPLVTCIWGHERRVDRLVVYGFSALLSRSDCGVGEYYVSKSELTALPQGYEFELEETYVTRSWTGDGVTYLYRRVK